MVAPEHHDGVIVQFETVEGVEQLADLGVRVADACIVAVDQLERGFVGDRAGGGNSGVRAEFAERMDGLSAVSSETGPVEGIPAYARSSPNEWMDSSGAFSGTA